ncbi:hypothetical protein [Bradyrhizobium prioriisuperbiae]|uniref:hypothetical protein n=1 Tax=Bradyrhizobium prioriisuperbiae TaxID=2854389 RepID=UPI0028E87E67|nr:hypothetical protein [Bradyrhizobium prioritasuperba]
MNWLRDWFNRASDRDITAIVATFIATVAFVLWMGVIGVSYYRSMMPCGSACLTDFSASRR